MSMDRLQAVTDSKASLSVYETYPHIFKMMLVGPMRSKTLKMGSCGQQNYAILEQFCLKAQSLDFNHILIAWFQIHCGDVQIPNCKKLCPCPNTYEPNSI